MQLCLLHLDDALELQPDFIGVCERMGASQIRVRDAGKVRLWSHMQGLDDLRENLEREFSGGNGRPRVCFMGSGDFHHVTSLLLPFALEQVNEPVTLIHFDNHPDWVRFNKGTHCGSWVNKAAEMPQIAKIITVGVCSHDLRFPEWKKANLHLLSQGKLELYPYTHAPSHVREHYGDNVSFTQADGALYWNTIREQGERNFISYLLSRINTQAVYFTVDKDVLRRDDAITNWDQGQIRLPYLLSLIGEISRKHRVIGADVTGDYSTPHYEGAWFTRFSKKAEVFLDQPRCQPDLQVAANINSAANYALLEAFAEAIA